MSFAYVEDSEDDTLNFCLVWNEKRIFGIWQNKQPFTAIKWEKAILLDSVSSVKIKGKCYCGFYGWPSYVAEGSYNRGCDLNSFTYSFKPAKNIHLDMKACSTTMKFQFTCSNKIASKPRTSLIAPSIL